MSKIIIEQSKDADAKEIALLGINSKELQIDDNLNQYYSEEDIITLLNSPDGICLSAKSGDTLIGFIILIFHSYFKELYISDIFVKPEFRGLHIGKDLLDKALELAKNKNPQWKWALVQCENEKMQRFLEKNGMKKGKSFYFYYSNI